MHMQKSIGKSKIRLPCKIVDHKDFSLKLGTRDCVVDITHHARFGSNRLIRGFPTNRWNITLFWLFCCPVLFSSSRAQPEPLHRFWRWMTQMTCFRPRTVLWSLDDGWRYTGKTPRKGGWIGSFITPKFMHHYYSNQLAIWKPNSDHKAHFVGGPPLPQSKYNMVWRWGRTRSCSRRYALD